LEVSDDVGAGDYDGVGRALARKLKT
jgi:hypothetical protein